MIFLGLLFPKSDEEEIRSKSRKNEVQNQANIFQWNLIEGLYENKQEVKMINCLPIGNFPLQYHELVTKKKKWEYEKKEHLQIGCVNLPLIKQITRAITIKRELIKSEEDSIVVYSTYLPFLMAVYNLDKTYNITLIVTDLPEYYDLGKTSRVRQLLRKAYNKLVYRYMSRIDSFVLLTEHMRESLKVGERPYVVIEGSYSLKGEKQRNDSGKKVIFYSGTLHYVYGIKTLLDAFSMIDDNEIELWICGIGEAEKEIKQWAEEDPRIKYFGYCAYSKVLELQSYASVLVNPRTDSGEYAKYSFPSKTMEYLASGVPVIMYKLRGIPSDYDEFVNYVTENDKSALKTMITTVCNDRTGIYKKKADLARTFIEKEKNSCVQAGKLIEMINSRVY